MGRLALPPFSWPSFWPWPWFWRGLCLSLCILTQAACSSGSALEQGRAVANWLTRCDSDRPCGEGSCECGVCTLACEEDVDCEGLSGSSCQPMRQVSACENAGGSIGNICARVCSDDAECTSEPSGRCEDGLCVALAPEDASVPGDASALGDASEAPRAGEFAPGKGPAHTLVLPVPGEQDWQYLHNDTWYYVAPPDAGLLYDAAYFNGQWYVLHGEIENSQKARVSEINWLSATRDGVEWETLTLTTEPYESYTRLATNGHSLLLAGTRHVAELVDDGIEPFEQLDQQAAPPVIIPHPDGYVLGRLHDIVWLGLDRTVRQTYSEQLAQFRAGVFAAGRFLMAGPFYAVTSPDGQSWSKVDDFPGHSGNLVGMAYGNGVHLAADAETLFTSTDGENWQVHVWERAIVTESTPLDEIGEDRIAHVDFTAGHFTLHTSGGNTSLSKDGVNWTAQLKIALGQIGPAACNERCLVAGGRLLLPPIVLSIPEPPPDADTSSPYYCQYHAQGAAQPPPAPPAPCFGCGGATVEECREGAICRQLCESDADCPDPGSGNPRVTCAGTQMGRECFLYCDQGESCPSGMTCSGGMCYYVFDDPRCI